MKTAYFKNKAEGAEINFLVKMFAFLRFVVCILSFEVSIISKTKFKRVIGPFDYFCFSFYQFFGQNLHFVLYTGIQAISLGLNSFDFASTKSKVFKIR